MATSIELAVLHLVAVAAHPGGKSARHEPSEGTAVQQLVDGQPSILDRVAQEEGHPRDELPAVGHRVRFGVGHLTMLDPGDRPVEHRAGTDVAYPRCWGPMRVFSVWASS